MHCWHSQPVWIHFQKHTLDKVIFKKKFFSHLKKMELHTKITLDKQHHHNDFYMKQSKWQFVGQ